MATRWTDRQRHGRDPAAWWWSTRSRLAAPHGPTWPPTPACSTTYASCSPPRKQARARRYDAGRFSFNVAKGRCETCQGEGFVMVELLFLPSVYAPCPTCHGSRYNAKTLEIKYRDKSIADVLGMTVDAALEFFRRRAPRPAGPRRRAAGRPGVPATRVSPPPSSPAEKRSGSSWPPSCSGSTGATRCISSTSPPPDCIRPTWSG